jgi:hypothetical protein
MNALLKLVTHYWHPDEVVEETPRVGVVEQTPRIGEYHADYSPLTPAEIAQHDSECEELFKHSKPLSR